jgi:hypothetical protein
MRTNYYCLTRNRKARARKKKKTNPKGKRHRVFWPRRTHDEKKNEPDKQKKTNFLPSSFFFYFFSFFGLRFPRDIANDDANDAQPKTTHNSGPCPLSFLF